MQNRPFDDLVGQDAQQNDGGDVGESQVIRLAATEALAAYRHVLVLMHVPPFHDACWHDGQLSDGNWAPHFVCAAAGEALRKVMAARPGQSMTVLCGHTHSSGDAQILSNLTVHTGAACYGRPVVQRMLEVGTLGMI